MSLWEATAIATNTGGGFFVDIMDEEFENFLGQIKSDQKKISPEDKTLLDEANELLKHCEEEEDFGPTHNPAKLDLQKFLFLKNLNNKRKVNKYLIRQLSLIAKKNILVRYLLIEAGLQNENIEKLLKETDFYHIRNNPEDFYFDNNVPKELRFPETTLKLRQKKFSILNPEESSYLVISKLTEEIAKNKIEEFARNLKLKMEHAFRVLIYSNKHKINPIPPTPETLITETFEDLKQYFEYIKSHYLYWSKSLVEAEFFKKSNTIDGSFILYLNEMYWLQSEKYQKFVEGFFYFPNLLIELYEKHEKGAELYFKKFENYMIFVDEEKKSKDLQIEKLRGANEVYQQVLTDKQAEEKKKIENMTESYIGCCERFLNDKPTIPMLEKNSGIEKNIWDSQLSNPLFLTHSLNEIKKKINQAKKNDTKEFWRRVYNVIERKLGKAYQDSKVPKVRFTENYDYEGRMGKKKHSDSDHDDFIDNIEV